MDYRTTFPKLLTWIRANTNNKILYEFPDVIETKKRKEPQNQQFCNYLLS